MIAPVSGQAIAASAVAAGNVILTDSDGQTNLRPGGPTATIQGIPVALKDSATVVGTNTYSVPLPSPSTGLGDLIMAAFNGGLTNPTKVIASSTTIGASIYAESALNSGDLKLSDPSTTFILTSGGATTTIAGIPVALHTGEIIVGSETIVLRVPNLRPASITIGSEFYAEKFLDSGGLELSDSSSTFTLTPSGTTKTIKGIPIALRTGEIVVGSNAIVLPVPTALLGETDSTTSAGPVFAANFLSHSDVVISDVATLSTLKSGESSVRIAGTPVALQTGDLIVGSSTFTLPSDPHISGGGGEAGNQRANTTGVVPFLGRQKWSDIPWSRPLIAMVGASLMSALEIR